MMRYLLRRLVQSLPILAGVVLLTFVLFNVVGGSPAAIVLGNNATPAALEEYDRLRGYDRPLFFGSWARTHALPDSFSAAERRWPAGPAHPLPLRFPLAGSDLWRLVLEYRSGPDAEAELLLRGPGGERRVSLDPAPRGGRVEVLLREGLDAAALEVSQGALDVRGLRLRRRLAHPLESQLSLFLHRLARLDLGVSSSSNRPVVEMLREGVGPSLSLTVPIFVGGLLAALLLALCCAWFRGRLPDRALVLGATVLMSVHYLVWVVAGQYLLAFRLGWFPIWGYGSWRTLVLPVLIGIVTGLGRDLRFYRAALLDEMYADYVRTARAKGAGPGRVLFRHVLRNALAPVLTSASLALPFLFMGSLLLESYFGIPGLGGVAINAINDSDIEVVRAVVLIGALLFVLVNLLTDLAYAWVDPRVRLR